MSQHLDALATANANRLARCCLKRAVATGKLTAADVILNPPAEAHRMMIGELLGSQHRWGDKRIADFLAQFEYGMSEAKTLGSLTARQRRMVAAALPQRPVGICSTCGKALIRLATDTAAASCECGSSDIPHEFFDAARRAAA